MGVGGLEGLVYYSGLAANLSYAAVSFCWSKLLVISTPYSQALSVRRGNREPVLTLAAEQSLILAYSSTIRSRTSMQSVPAPAAFLSLSMR